MSALHQISSSTLSSLPGELTAPNTQKKKPSLLELEAPTPSGKGVLDPVRPRDAGVSVPAGPWLSELAGADALQKPFADAFLESQRQTFVEILESGLPGRSEMVKAAIQKRLESPAALNRGIADWRDAEIMKELKTRTYVGRAGFVLNSEDGHANQPNTVRHHGVGRVMSIGDSDRIGCAPYELEVRSWLTSLELISRSRHFSPSTGLKAMRAFLEAYRSGIESVAKAEDPEQVAKSLRITEDNPPAILEPYFQKAEDKSHEEWLKKVIDKEPLRFASNPEKLIPLPDDQAGVKVRSAIMGAIPAYLEGLKPEEREKLKDLSVADIVMPVKGNGSLGFGRYQVLLAPPDNKRQHCVVLELKEQVAAPLDSLIDQAPSAMYGDNSAKRAVNLFRLGTGKHAAEDWGQVEIPGAGVRSTHFTVKQVHGDEVGMDLVDIKQKELIELARAQGQIVAAFQALGGLNDGGVNIGGPQDIFYDFNARPSFNDESVKSARDLAAKVEAQFAKFKQAFQGLAA